jgi:hypothetical protein
VGNDQEETWQEYLYSFQPFTRPTFRQIAHHQSTDSMTGAWTVWRKGKAHGFIARGLRTRLAAEGRLVRVAGCYVLPNDN